MWGTYVHICTKYEVSMSNPVSGGGVYIDADADNDDDGQCILVETHVLHECIVTY